MPSRSDESARPQYALRHGRVQVLDALQLRGQDVS
jgi:hypothetical protein